MRLADCGLDTRGTCTRPRLISVWNALDEAQQAARNNIVSRERDLRDDWTTRPSRTLTSVNFAIVIIIISSSSASSDFTGTESQLTSCSDPNTGKRVTERPRPQLSPPEASSADRLLKIAGQEGCSALGALCEIHSFIHFIHLVHWSTPRRRALFVCVRNVIASQSSKVADRLRVAVKIHSRSLDSRYLVPHYRNRNSPSVAATVTENGESNILLLLHHLFLRYHTDAIHSLTASIGVARGAVGAPAPLGR